MLARSRGGLGPASRHENEKGLPRVSFSGIMADMLGRILEKRLASAPKSVLLLGPRQVGKSTLPRRLGPDIEIQLADVATRGS